MMVQRANYNVLLKTLLTTYNLGLTTFMIPTTVHVASSVVSLTCAFGTLMSSLYSQLL